MIKFLEKHPSAVAIVFILGLAIQWNLFVATVIWGMVNPWSLVFSVGSAIPAGISIGFGWAALDDVFDKNQ